MSISFKGFLIFFMILLTIEIASAAPPPLRTSDEGGTKKVTTVIDYVGGNIKKTQNGITATVTINNDNLTLSDSLSVANNVTSSGELWSKGDLIYHGTSRIMNGMCEDRQDLFLVTESGNIYFETEKIDGGDLEYVFNEREYDLDCTTGAGVGGRARVQLTEGSATNEQINYIYVELVDGNLSLSSSTSIPTGTFGWVAMTAIQTDTELDANLGPLQVQRMTESFKHNGSSTTGNVRGALSYMREKIRWMGAKYVDGSGGSQTIQITTNGGAVDNINLTVSSCEVFQHHRQTWDEHSVLVDGIFVANASGDGNLTNLQKLTDLSGALELQDGTLIGNNKRFVLTIWGSINSDVNGRTQHRLFVNLPTGVYSTNDGATTDLNRTAVTSVPPEYQTTAFLIAKMPFKYNSASGGTWTDLGVQSILGQSPNAQAGGASSVSLNMFSDSDFEIFDNGDSTKTIAFEASGITTGTTRTFTAPDEDGTLVTSENPITFGDSISINDLSIKGNLSPSGIVYFVVSDADGDNVRRTALPYPRADGSGGAGSPGGANTEIQYNNSGSFGGISELTYSGTIVTYKGVELRTDGAFEINITGDLQPTAAAAFSDTVWELNGNDDLQPKSA